MSFVVPPSIDGSLIYRLPYLHITRAHNRSFISMKIQTFFVPFQANILDELFADRFLIHHQFFILHIEYLAGEQVLPMGHQALIVQVILAQFRQREGGFKTRETVKKYRDAGVQWVALTVDDTGVREQGFNKPDSGKVFRQFVSDARSARAVKRQFLQIPRRILYRHFSIDKCRAFREGLGVFELLSNGMIYRENSSKFTSPMNQGMAREDLLNQRGTGSGHTHDEHG